MPPPLPPGAAGARLAANLEESRAGLAQARSQFERFRDLREKQLASRSQMDQALADYRSAQAREEAARAALAEARERMEHPVVRAP